MSRIWAASILIVMLAACSAQDGRDAPPAAEVSQAAGYNPFPGGVSMPSSYHLREDRFYVSEGKGHLRRKVVLEMLDQEMGQSIEEIEKLMHVAGYRVSGEPTSTKKATKLKFKKKGHPTVTAEFRPGPGKKPANPRARHPVVFRWKVANSLDAWMAGFEGVDRN